MWFWIYADKTVWENFADNIQSISSTAQWIVYFFNTKYTTVLFGRSIRRICVMPHGSNLLCWFLWKSARGGIATLIFVRSWTRSCMFCEPVKWWKWLENRRNWYFRQETKTGHNIQYLQWVTTWFNGLQNCRRLFKKGGSGWRGIRTHGTVTRTPVFKTGPLNHSGIHPGSAENKTQGAEMLQLCKFIL